MQFYRCKCGEAQSWTTMGVQPCLSCPKCGSDLAQDPSLHREPEPHNWITRYDPNTGAPYKVCERCMKRQADEVVAAFEAQKVKP